MIINPMVILINLIVLFDCTEQVSFAANLVAIQSKRSVYERNGLECSWGWRFGAG